jgi:hypothetical protein
MNGTHVSTWDAKTLFHFDGKSKQKHVVFAHVASFPATATTTEQEITKKTNGYHFVTVKKCLFFPIFTQKKTF